MHPFRRTALTFLVALALTGCGPNDQDAPSGAPERANPGTRGIVHQTVVQLPFHTRPERLWVNVIDNTMILEGDIALQPDRSFDWASAFAKGREWTSQWKSSDLNIAEWLERGRPLFESAELKTWLQEQYAAPPYQGALANNQADQRWTGGKVPYAFSPDFPLPLKTRVEQAANHIGQKTNVRFVPRTNEPHYLEFVKGPGAWSHVGMQGGRQEICLATWCDFGSVVHEMCHALGLWHEQSRSDRDQYVEIVWENVRDEDRHNFDKRVERTVNLGPYDYGSIMHYPGNAFSKNGQTTVKPLNARAILGQRRGLSEGDIAALAVLYPSTQTPAPSTPAVVPAPAKAVIETAFSNDVRYAYFFQGYDCWRYDRVAQRMSEGYPRKIYLIFPGVTWTGVDACTPLGDGKILFFRGEDYLRFDVASNKVEKGFPKKTKLNFPGLPWGRLDAALEVPGGKILFFRNGEVARCDAFSGKLDSGYPKKISELYPGVWPDPDAVIHDGEQGLFFFKGKDFLRFNVKNKQIDPGYPKPISSYWKGM